MYSVFVVVDVKMCGWENKVEDWKDTNSKLDKEFNTHILYSRKLKCFHSLRYELLFTKPK